MINKIDSEKICDGISFLLNIEMINLITNLT